MSGTQLSLMNKWEYNNYASDSIERMGKMQFYVNKHSEYQYWAKIYVGSEYSFHYIRKEIPSQEQSN